MKSSITKKTRLSLAFFCLSIASSVACDESPAAGACGDGKAEPNEQCDDGNRQPGDGCDEGCDLEWDAHLADTVVDAPGDQGPGAGHGDAQRAVNGVRGCGASCGSTDVFSLGYRQGKDDYLVVRWRGARVLDGPGPDFVVFENAFDAGGGSGRFMDHVVVCVSEDNQSWVCFPHDYQATDESVYEADPTSWVGFAGVAPVLFHCELNPVDPFDRQAAGGDAFDLQDLEPGEQADRIRHDGFIYLKLISAPSRTNPDTGEPFVRDPISNGPDIDGIYARLVAPE